MLCCAYVLDQAIAILAEFSYVLFQKDHPVGLVDCLQLTMNAEVRRPFPDYPANPHYLLNAYKLRKSLENAG